MNGLRKVLTSLADTSCYHINLALCAARLSLWSRPLFRPLRSTNPHLPYRLLIKDQNLVPVNGQVLVENFEVQYKVNGRAVVNPDWTYSKLYFTLDFPFAAFANTSVIISEEIKELSGRPMGIDDSWSLKTPV